MSDVTAGASSSAGGSNKEKGIRKLQMWSSELKSMHNVHFSYYQMLTNLLRLMLSRSFQAAAISAVTLRMNGSIKQQKPSKWNVAAAAIVSHPRSSQQHQHRHCCSTITMLVEQWNIIDSSSISGGSSSRIQWQR